MKRFCGLLCLIALTVPLGAGTMKIIGTCDIHGRFRKLAGFVPLFKSFPDAVKVDLGDLIQGNVLSDVTDGALAVEVLNHLGFDLWVPGNHDFELGHALLARRCREFRGRVLGGTQWRTKDFAPLVHTVIERGKFRCGFIGLTEAAMAEKAPLFAEFNFKDARNALREAVDSLKLQKCNAIVLLWHNGIRTPYGTLGQMLWDFPEINAVILAHSHKEVISYVADRTLAIQPDAHGRNAALLTLEFCDETGKLKYVTGRLVSPAKFTDPALEAVIRKSSSCYREFLAQKVCFVTSEKSFAAAAAQKLCRLAQSDLAVFDYPKLVCGSWDRFRLLASFPYRNRIFTVQVTAKEVKQFAAERVPAKRKRFIYGMDKLRDDKIYTLALDDFQLFSSPTLRQKKNLARCRDIIGREILYGLPETGRYLQ